MSLYGDYLYGMGAYSDADVTPIVATTLPGVSTVAVIGGMDFYADAALTGASAIPNITSEVGVGKDAFPEVMAGVSVITTEPSITLGGIAQLNPEATMVIIGDILWEETLDVSTIWTDVGDSD